MELKEILLHPLAAVAALGSVAFAVLPGLEPLWSFIGATAGTWFPPIAVTAGTILPEVGLGDLGGKILIAAGIVYVLVYVDRLLDAALERLEE
jgi:hypothetical protein